MQRAMLPLFVGTHSHTLMPAIHVRDGTAAAVVAGGRGLGGDRRQEGEGEGGRAGESRHVVEKSAVVGDGRSGKEINKSTPKLID